ncbi:sensor histidine kinase N-terminal domain-containing protein [Pelomonas sp. CA6]|uniref:sensor histidine kinase n=1 Tax=Pelomonas sp. CA6 TaxID=2907999 RepID=UPI001F4A54A0|nr:sensor histidine kinase [Pelomonas sp. CA6]MCH7342957.1 sensor histidine kinase N-terminal domain-containing protein [Pelomonas sp. CA6]
MSAEGRRHWLVSVPGARSLRRQLLVWLLLPQIVLWVAAAIFTYNLAASYASRAIDASLSQASRALARQVKPLDSGLLIDFPRAAQDILEADPSDRVLYMVSTPPGQFILGNRHLPGVPAGVPTTEGEPYFYDGVLREADGASHVRVAALYLRYGEADGPAQTMLVQVARSSANREELAREILRDTVLPLSVLIVLMTMIVWTGIRAGLAPLSVLQRQVEGRAANDLAPIKISAAPPEVRALAGAINTLLGEVQHSVAVQKRFISDAAHQLRTPLAGLKSQTELALRDASDPELLARLRRVHESAVRSAHLINQLLLLARAEPESASLQDRRPLDLRRLARELCTEMVPRALQAGVDLGFDESGDEEPPVMVSGIALLLREAISNLIDNAIRYAGRGATVTLRVRQQGAQALLEVEDNGPGLPPSELERVFERFVRATHDGSGCGLGLAIVREIVERHAGQVRLAPLRPHGLVARVTLPCDDGRTPAQG